MDKKRFEYIETKEEVLILLGQGERLFTSDMTEFYYDKDNEAVMRHDYCGKPQMTTMPINDLLYRGLYIKKPFDVPQEMLNRPGEWVAKFKADDTADTWYKVGLDKKLLRVVKAKTTDDTGVSYESIYCSRHYIDVDNLDKYILIEAEEGENENG